MARLAIIGSSHVGALKEAWDVNGARYAGHEVSFFAAPQPRYRMLRLIDRRVFGLSERLAREDPKSAEVVAQINGRTSIDLSEVDAVLLCAPIWPQRAIAELMIGYDIDGLREAGAPRRLSRPAFDAICAELAESGLPARTWRGLTAPRVAVQGQAVPAETCVSNDGPRYLPWHSVVKRPDGCRAVVDAFLETYQAVLRRNGFDLIRQPVETLLPSGMTAAKYTRGSRRLKARVLHPDNDPLHMNAEFGALCLPAIFAWLEKVTSPTQALAS